MNRSVAVWILVALGAMAALVTGWVLLRSPGAFPESAGGPLSAEEAAYLSQISVTEARMSAARNYLGDTIIFLDAKVTNRGSRSVRDVQLQLEYVDTLGQVVLRDFTHAVTTRMPPLEAGKTRDFRVSYDHMPADWNQAPPKVTVLRVSF
jgi:hypothetical protein